MAGRKRKYTVKTLREAVDRYFNSITRTVTMTELVPTGERDNKGHEVLETREIVNNLGEAMQIEEYLVPPTVGGLCIALDIHRSTWAEYCDPERHPEFSDTTTRARGRMRAYLERELLTRKDVKGILFDLQNNYGMRDRREIELGPKATKALSGSVSTEEREELLQLLREEAERDDGDHAGAD